MAQMTNDDLVSGQLTVDSCFLGQPQQQLTTVN